MEIESQDFIDFKNIRSHINIQDYKLLIVYLKEIYYDLSERSETNKKGITKITFLDYIKLPMFIGEKVFNSLDKDKDSFLNSIEFVEGLSNLFSENFEKSVEAIFNVYDFDKDSMITRDDVEILLSHLPLKEKHFNLQYKFQMDSLKEIQEILNLTFEMKKRLNLTEFLYAIENKKSDVFLQLLCFIYQRKPFNENNMNKFNMYKKSASYLQNEKLNELIDKNLHRIIPSPNKNSYLLPIHQFLTNTSLKPDEEKKNDANDCPKNIGIVRMPKEIIVLNRHRSNDNLDNIIKNSKNSFNSPTTILKKTRRSNNISDFTISNILVKMRLGDDNENNENSSINLYSNNNSNCHSSEYENWVYKLSESLKMKKYWLVLSSKEIYYYKSPKKEELLVMHNLSGCILKENGKKKFEDKTMYGFSIQFTGKNRHYYCEEDSSYKMWTSNIQKSIGYLNFFDYYTILEDIGEGKFGKVKLGIYKKTNEKVAIKIIKKESLKNTSDIELVKSEIDIMKLCKHPNVIRLVDDFENNEYIFIVMEYLDGGDLGEYLDKKNFKISEKKAKLIMIQLASAVKYLHQFGILHRDLKPENIMLSDESEEALVKVMDFGLSKIIGPGERLADGFGSLSYVAPEVLIRKPYDKKIDIWSLGIILYNILSGSLPFDDKDDNEELIAKMIVFSDVKFPPTVWNIRSTEVLDLISKCLVKDPNNRITLDSFLNHDWIKHNV